MFNTYLYEPLLNSLLFLDGQLGSFGWAIIFFTLLVRFVLFPLTLPSLKSAAKMKEIQPEINKLKKQHKDDPAAMQQAQLALFKEKKVNPAAGCLPQILQIVIFISLYRIFIDLLQNGADQLSSSQFLWLNLTEPDPLYILPIITGLSQLILGLMISPAADTTAEKVLASNTETKEDDKKAEDMTAMAQTMQQQMIFIMPFMTAFIALRFPSGLALYWVVSTIFSIGMQAYVSGFGGLVSRIQLVKQKIVR